MERRVLEGKGESMNGQEQLIDVSHLEVETKKIILTNVSDIETSDDFGQEASVDFEGRGVMRETRVRTKDGSTIVKYLVVMESIKFSKVNEG